MSELGSLFLDMVENSNQLKASRARLMCALKRLRKWS